MAELTQEQQFLSILNNMLDLMSNLTEGEYLQGADMCKKIKTLVDNMRTNVVYIHMSREREFGITNAQKLASGNYFTCPKCNLIVRKDDKCIKRHSKCMTHLRGMYMNKLIQKGYRQEDINDFIKRKMLRMMVNEDVGKWSDLNLFCKKHIEKIRDN